MRKGSSNAGDLFKEALDLAAVEDAHYDPAR